MFAALGKLQQNYSYKFHLSEVAHQNVCTDDIPRTRRKFFGDIVLLSLEMICLKLRKTAGRRETFHFLSNP
jgi:hypothetical protein